MVDVMGYTMSAQIAEVFYALMAGNALTTTELPPPQAAEARRTLDSDLQVNPPYGLRGGSTIYRLREGIERFMITDINNPAASAQAQSTIIVAFDVVNEDPASSGVGLSMNHVPGGANALYMDGHVEFVRYVPTGNPPANATTARTLYGVSVLGDAM